VCSVLQSETFGDQTVMDNQCVKYVSHHNILRITGVGLKTSLGHETGLENYGLGLEGGGLGLKASGLNLGLEYSGLVNIPGKKINILTG